MINALTIDVEDYFQVNAFERHVRKSDWGNYPLRVGTSTERILDILSEHNVRATFFVLGWVVEQLPELVRKIQRHGHEVACHGYGHELVYRIGPEKFRADIRAAKTILEDISGEQVNGYRAPSYSITGKSLWALDILIEEGFTYDSSIFPVYHDTYGIPDAPRFPHKITRPSGSIWEFPLTTLPLSLWGRKFRFPIAGGGYLRLLPAWAIRKGIRRINEYEQKPAVLYIHPWEIDPEQPRIKASLKSRFRHYLNLHSTERKFESLLREVRFAPMDEVLKLEAQKMASNLGT